MKTYCKQDVEILRKGCLAFQTQIMKLTDGECDPFKYCTLTGVAAAVYNGIFLKPETIAANGYSTPKWLFNSLQFFLQKRGMA